MWKTCFQNRICQTQDQSREQNQHIERLFYVKPMINSSEPYKPLFLKDKVHQQVLKEDLETKVNYENNIIETRKREIKYKDGQYSKNVLEPKIYPAFDGYINRKNEERQNKIDLSNYKFYWKIETLRPNYSRRQMHKEAKDQEKYLNNILKRPKSIPYRPALNFLSIDQIKSRLEKQLAINLLYRQQLQQELINQQQQQNNNTNNKSKTSRKGSSAKKNGGGSRKNTEGGNSLNKSKRSHRSQSSKNRKSLKINEGGEIEENGKGNNNNNEGKGNVNNGCLTFGMEVNKKENSTTKATTTKKNY